MGSCGSKSSQRHVEVAKPSNSTPSKPPADSEGVTFELATPSTATSDMTTDSQIGARPTVSPGASADFNAPAVPASAGSRDFRRLHWGYQASVGKPRSDRAIAQLYPRRSVFLAHLVPPSAELSIAVQKRLQIEHHRYGALPDLTGSLPP